jgi:hypothetical protein
LQDIFYGESVAVLTLALACRRGSTRVLALFSLGRRVGDEGKFIPAFKQRSPYTSSSP